MELRSRQESDATEQASVALTLENIEKRFEDADALRDVSLEVRRGELMTLLGPSGCGKTTMLRLLAGLERPDTGTITLDGRHLSGPGSIVPPEDRPIGLVFQEFALFPHLSVSENVGFGISDLPASERRDRVQSLLELVDLEEFGDSDPGDLSGGQRQRVALARSLAVEPEVLLLDEPFSNLDVGLRVTMREEVRRIIKEAGVTAISVTHDQEEAMAISDRVAVMHDGRIEQVGTPETVFERPSSRFVAGFLGHASFLSATVSGDLVDIGIGSVRRRRIHGLDDAYDDTEIDVMVRPDDVIARPTSGGGDGTVTYRRYLGPTVLYRVELDSGDVVECIHNHDEDLSLDDRVAIELDTSHGLAWFPRDV